MSSGANIVPGDHPDIGTCDEEFPPDDARAMSPRRSSAEVEKLGEDARRALQMFVFLFLLKCFSNHTNSYQTHGHLLYNFFNL